jgi:hypothetical protein
MMENSFAVRRESRSTTILVRSNSDAVTLEGAASLRAAPAVARWKDAVESVRQSPILSVDIEAGVTNSEIQEPRPIAKARPVSSRFGDSPQIEHVPQISFEPLQEWEGCVVETQATTFTATLIDITDRRKFEDEVAEFALTDLSDDDLLLLRPGAIFRWLIGYERHPSGTKRRASSVVFRRLPNWSENDLSRAKQEAKSLVEEITWD